MAQRLTLSFIFGAIGFIALQNASAESSSRPLNREARLIDHLTRNYPPSHGIARPVHNVSERMNVTFAMMFQELLGIDEQAGVMHMTGSVVGRWRDVYLTWNPAEFDGIDAIPINPADIFLPKIIPVGSTGDRTPVYDTYAAMPNYNGGRQHSAIVWTDYEGNVTATTNGIFDTPCKMELYHFPFDVQRCEFVFKTLRLKKARINLKVSNQCVAEGVSQTKGHNNPMWTIDSVECVEKTLNITQAAYSVVVFRVTVRRKFDYYMRRILLPSAAMAMLQLGTFLMPFGASRVMFGITTVLIVDIFQSSHSFVRSGGADQSSSSQPLPLEKYTTAQLIVGILITFESIVIWRLSRCCCAPFRSSALRQKAARYWRTHFASKRGPKALGRNEIALEEPVKENGLLGLQKALVNQLELVDSEPEADDGEGHSTPEREAKQQEYWRRLANSLDFVLMILFSITAALLPVAFFLVD